MGGFLRRCLVVWAAGLLATGAAHGQVAGGSAGGASETALDVLHQFSDRADVIFFGEVLAIRGPNDGMVEVEFRVDEAIRGCSLGTHYVLREWAGLWAGGIERYRVGERLLMMLHAPSAAGLSSPVGGLDGAIPIRLLGTGTATGSGTAKAGVGPEQPYVDLRWLGARLPHAVSYRSEPKSAERRPDLATPRIGQPTMLAVKRGSVVDASTMTAKPQSPASVPAQQASVSAVMGMLSSWQRAQHVAP